MFDLTCPTSRQPDLAQAQPPELRPLNSEACGEPEFYSAPAKMVQPESSSVDTFFNSDYGALLRGSHSARQGNESVNERSDNLGPTKALDVFVRRSVLPHK
jgi:hypothetical protein